MKNLLLFAFLLISMTSFAQYEKVFIDSTKSQIEIFGKTQEFITNSFKSAKSVTQMNDPETGVIMCKGILATKLNYTMNPTNTWATIKFISKKGKCKMVVFDIYIDGIAPANTYKGSGIRTWDEIMDGKSKGKERYIEFVSNLESEIKILQYGFEKELNKKEDF